ncbi:flagellar assembly protein FliH [Vreelandella songnenensis]|uniref:Flagellar assembly protein FliH n=1 Tax=Vreelandella songnenensis TaxID=1176243 RepID=A0A2T0V358_9GAMM|nr:flagellar assembly protein FliH [Halomonas songnenensis]PRY64591.1 flagellar assembly protein FliH [Halomonas songnenensis]
MSNPSTPEFDRHGSWKRWQMDELGTPHRDDGRTFSSEPTAHQRKVLAAQKAAEQAHQREQQERQAIYDQLRQEAEEKGYQAGLEKGHAEGVIKGLEEGRAQAHDELENQIRHTITPLEALAKQFADALDRIDDTIAHDLVELALATGRQLAGDALQQKPEQVLTIVRELLHTEPPLVGQQRLWLNTEDHAVVEQHLGTELSAAGWKLQPDDQLARGGCRVTSAQGELDATFETRWQAIESQARKRHSSNSASS